MTIKDRLSIKKPSAPKARIFLHSMAANAATVFDKLVFFALSVITARYLGLEQFGEYASALAFATFFSIFADPGIGGALVRAVSLEPKSERAHFASALAAKLFFSVGAYGALALALYFTGFNPNTVYLALILGIARVGNVFLAGFYALYDAKERFLLSSFFNSSFSFSVLAGTVFVVLLKRDYFALAWVRAGIVLAYIAAVGALTLYYFRPMWKPGRFPGFLKSAIPFGLSSLFNNIGQNAAVPILSLMHGTTPAGIFTTGYLFLSSLFFIPSNLNRVLLPYLYRCPYPEQKEKFQFAHDLYAKLYALMSLYIFIVLFFYSREFILIVFGERYAASIDVLRVSAFGVPFVFTVAGALIQALDLQRALARLQGMAAAFNIVACVVFIRLYGAEGAAAAVVLSSALLFFSMYFFLYWRHSMRLYRTFFVYVKLILIVLALYALYATVFSALFFVYSFLVISALYAAAAALLLVTSDDIRVIRETVGVKWIRD
ncbi:MAG: oligosaccharide flippase family protein [Spirochaetes bacterium]|nr:oligosaccharide flippase family protein [Spirochaetota bacterium]